MSKHTPTPWQQYSEHEPLRIIGNVDGPDDDRMHYTTVCEVNAENDQAESDSRHIVHCVNLHDELVEALEAFIAAIRQQYAKDGILRLVPGMHLFDPAEKAFAVLAKAKEAT